MSNVPSQAKQIDATIWEIPTSYKRGMLVPGRIIATKKLFDQIDTQVFDQIANVAMLPGIQKYSLAMPDCHRGYGVAIGGVAAFDTETGIISPGGIGFDINCLHPDTTIHLQHGTFLPIRELEQQWKEFSLPFLEKEKKEKKETNIVYFLKKKELQRIYSITTASSHIIKVTGDHPIMTLRGMIPASQLSIDDKVITHGFRGVSYEKPSDKIILTKDDFIVFLQQHGVTSRGNALNQIISFLEQRGLLPLCYNSRALPQILKLMGHIFGDGALTFVNQRKGQITCYGNQEDLQDIQKDLASISIAGNLSYRTREHLITRKDYTSQFTFEEHSLYNHSTALAWLLVALGTPHGKKTHQEYKIPLWIMQSFLWQKRLFLASFFGAELSSPSTQKNHGYTFYDLQLNMNKAENISDSGIAFLEDIRTLLGQFGVCTREISFVECNDYEGIHGKTIGLRLSIPSLTENLVTFFERVGYIYQREKEKLASLASIYLGWKRQIIEQREEIRQSAKSSYAQDVAPEKIVSALCAPYANERFILRSIYEQQTTSSRIAAVFPSFADFISTSSYGSWGFVVESLEEIKINPYYGYVYDLTINDTNHNFIANTFVTSNCGMRLLTTNLTIKDVQPKLKELVDHIFKTVPAGVGCKGFVKVNHQQFDDVMTDGVKWCVDNGYGWKEDITRCEGKGKIDWADSSKVSDKAKKRGIDQLGTLGSGNHYLEIQVVKKENIHDAALAKKFGITQDGQIVVMIHCLHGSSRVMTEHGAWIKIKDLENISSLKVKTMNFSSHQLEIAPIEKFFKLKPHGKTYRISTATQKDIIATEDHPFLTEQGLSLVNELSVGSKIAVIPYMGVEYTLPPHDLVIDENDLRIVGASEKTIRNLKKRNLLPLYYDSEKFPIIVKLLGFLIGDGWLGKNKDRWTAKFIGAPEDLQDIQTDIRKLGYNCNSISSVTSKSVITQTNGLKRSIEGTSYQFSVSSLGLPLLFYALGAPAGKKSEQEFRVPRWILNAPLWIKRIYLAAFFGAEMSKPATRKHEHYRFGSCKISLNKIEDLRENAYAFLEDIRQLLTEFKIECGTIIEQNAIINKKGQKTIKCILQVSSAEQNVIALWSKIGYEYNRKRSILASYALQYLQYKNVLLEEEAFITGKSTQQLQITNFKSRKTSCMTFAEFVLSCMMHPASSVLWDTIEKIEELKNFDEYVYDIRVDHPDHNFIADHFITGNCGSRGLGHQVATDYLRVFETAMKKYNITVPDKELSCAPFNSPEGQDYYKAMACAANMAFANRQVILHRVREAFAHVFQQKAEDIDMNLIYDVAHNVAKVEEHKVDGKKKQLVVHRKGSTRAFPPGHPELIPLYKETGQPIILGGSMETGSALLVGTQKAMDETFGSTAHGSGRTMSRTTAKNTIDGKQLQKNMEKKGIYVRTTSYSGLAEEAGAAYKEIDDVIDTLNKSGISKSVVLLRPIGNIKG